MSYKIKFIPDQKDVQIEVDQTILSASLAAGIPHAQACGGYARCSSCRVVVVEGIEHCEPRNEEEMILADGLGFTDRVRLACQTKVNGELTVKRAILDDIDMELIGQGFKNKDKNKSLGEEIEATLLFADIEGYTGVTETALPYDVVHMLNRYYFSMGKIVGHHQGQIMDYFGDGFLAIFGLQRNEDHARLAIDSGKAMHQQMKKMNPYFNNLFGRDFNVRIGINTGTVILGSIGVEGMQKLAAIGDAVNLASRIEAINKTLETSFLISDSTYRQVEGQVETKNMHEVELKGKSGTYIVHEL